MKDVEHIEPRGAAEWQEAVDMAEFILLLDSCVQYGLIRLDPGGGYNAQRAHALLERGRKLGFRPAAHEVLCARYIEARAPGE